MSHKYNNIVCVCYNCAFEKCICTLFHQPHCCRVQGTEELLVHSGVVCSSQCYVSYTNSRYIYLPGVVFTPGDLVRSRRVVDDITVLVILQQQAFNPVAFMLQIGRVSIDEKSRGRPWFFSHWTNRKRTCSKTNFPTDPQLLTHTTQSFCCL